MEGKIGLGEKWVGEKGRDVKARGNVEEMLKAKEERKEIMIKCLR